MCSTQKWLPILQVVQDFVSGHPELPVKPIRHSSIYRTTASRPSMTREYLALVKLAMKLDFMGFITYPENESNLYWSCVTIKSVTNESIHKGIEVSVETLFRLLYRTKRSLACATFMAIDSSGGDDFKPYIMYPGN